MAGIQGTLTAKILNQSEKQSPRRSMEVILIHQKWTYGEQSMVLKHICPWGMVKFVTNLLQQERGSKIRYFGGTY